MAKRRVVHALVAVGTFLWLLCMPAFADSYARIVRLSDIEGSVEIDRNTGQGFERAILNTPITQGMRIQTGLSGRAEIEFENGSVVRLAGDSLVEIPQLFLRSDGAKDSEIQVDQGTVYVNYRRKGDDDFRVSFANRSVDLARDVHFRVDVASTNVELAVFKGELKLKGEEQTATIKKNESLSLDLSDGSRYELAKGINQLSTDDWDQQREEYLNQYASAQSYNNSPYSYGYSDLNYYGSYFDVPGYGYLWRPYGVGYGWDPYANGAWAWYPSCGYTWVSAYPWGWQPYRYGSWVHVPGYGWAWQPGKWNHWHPGPVVVNPPPAYRGPVAPAPGSGTTVIVGTLPIVRPPRGVIVEDGSLRRKGNLPPPEAGIRPAPPTATKETQSVPANGMTGKPIVVQPSRPAVHSQLERLDIDQPKAAKVPDSMRTPRSMQPSAPLPSAPPTRSISPAPSSPPSAPRSAPAPSAPRSSGGASPRASFSAPSGGFHSMGATMHSMGGGGGSRGGPHR